MTLGLLHLLARSWTRSSLHHWLRHHPVPFDRPSGLHALPPGARIEHLCESLGGKEVACGDDPDMSYIVLCHWSCLTPCYGLTLESSRSNCYLPRSCFLLRRRWPRNLFHGCQFTQKGTAIRITPPLRLWVLTRHTGTSQVPVYDEAKLQGVPRKFRQHLLEATLSRQRVFSRPDPPKHRPAEGPNAEDPNCKAAGAESGRRKPQAIAIGGQIPGPAAQRPRPRVPAYTASGGR
mmetsp:Transcript_22447/g.66558  ORF Transcript_22447/g.66558 Transcript_22447/m.66558 type:complete len:234 (-) Transcript_22447:401-1102(-)